MIRQLFLITILCFLGISCNETVSDPVRVVTKGIYVPVSISVNELGLKSSYDLDEYVKGSDPLVVKIEIRNNSGYPLNDINLTFADSTVLNYDFLVLDSGLKEFPGKGGTCDSQLPSGQSCTIYLGFSSLVSGQITQTVNLKYKNIVEPGDETFTLTVFSGDPASLVFKPDTLNYHFGELTGLAQVPLVERDQRMLRSQTLTVENAGELRARNVLSSLSQNCTSKLSGSCPSGLGDAYEVVDYNCPDELKQNETCTFTVEYENKNQGSDPDYKDVSFTSTVKLDYTRDPNGNTAALNAYFESTSANIEAFFESTLQTIAFETPLTVGTRDKVSFRIKNTGYREGYLRKILIYENDATDYSFYCQKGVDSILDCYKKDGTVATLEMLPIFFTDTQGCMNSTMDKDFPIDTSCIFDVHFQPSVNYKSGGNIDFDIRFDYDARNLGQETLVVSDDVAINLSGEWKSAARLEWQDIKVGGSSPREMTNEVEVAGLSSDLSLTQGQFYSIGALGSNIPLRHQDFTNACEPKYDINGDEVGTLIEFSGLSSGSVVAKFYDNYQGQGKGVFIESGSATLTNGSLVSFDNCQLVKWHDLGRLAMELWEFYERDTVQIKFVNNGEVEANNIRLVDGDGNTIVMGSPISLGDGVNNCSSSDSDPCNFYENVTLGCSTLSPSTDTFKFVCTVSFNFAPIKRENDTEALSKDSMFDHISSSVYENFKKFRIVYENGSKYQDSNRTTTTPDISEKEIETRLHGVLVNKGLLSKMTLVEAPLEDAVAGGANYISMQFRNIGTGSIPYIHDVGTSLGSYGAIIPAIDLEDGELDCNDIIDWNTTGSSLGSLSSGQSCRLRFKFEKNNSHKLDPSIVYGPSSSQSIRFFNLGADPNFLWEYSPSTPMGVSVVLSYYDGDVTSSSKSGTYSSTYGDESSSNSNYSGVKLKNPPNLIPGSPSPSTSAIMMRPSYVKNDLYHDGNLVYPGETPERVWYYYPTNINILESKTTPEVTRPTGDLNDALFTYKGIEHAKSVLPSICADCEFFVHFGTFRAGEEKDLSFAIVNQGGAIGTITNLSLGGSTSSKFSIDPLSEFSNEPVGPNVGKVVKLKLNTLPSDNGTFIGTVEYSVDSSIPIDKVSAPNHVWNYKVAFMAEVKSSYPEVEFDYQKYEVETYDNSVPTENLLPTEYDLLSSFDLQNVVNDSVNSMRLEMVRRVDPESDPYAGYAKKRIIVKRKNADVNNIKLILKDNASETTSASTSGLEGFSYTDTCDGVSLTTSSPECYIDVVYQPGTFALSRKLAFSVVYELAPNQFTAQNVIVTLVPKIPGKLSPRDAQFSNTYGGVDSLGDPTAYALEFGNVIYDENNKIIQISDVVISNDSVELPASFLKSYQMNNGITDPSVYPASNEWVDIDGRKYIPIHTTVHSDGSDRLTVFASEECLYGSAPPGTTAHDSLAHNERGFVAGGAECSLDIKLRMNANYINLDLSNRGAMEVMQHNYFKLFYYSYDRIEDGQISFYLKGRIRPDKYAKNDDFYDVFADDTKFITFSFPEVDPLNPSVGVLTGYRIFYSETKSGLDNILSEQTASFLSNDVSLGSGNNTVNVDTSEIPFLSRGKAYYFKVMAIRYNSNYTALGFQDLPEGYYLSDGDLPTLRVVVPKFGFGYIHDLNVMVKKDGERTNGTLLGPITYTDAVDVCAGVSPESIDDPSSPKGIRAYKLITDNIWEVLRADPLLSNYSGGENYLEMPHWLADGAYDIETIFSAEPGYSEFENHQEFADIQQFYFRCTDDCDFDRKMGGGFFGQDFQDYISYVGETVSLGYARCYVDVSF